MPKKEREATETVRERQIALEDARLQIGDIVQLQSQQGSGSTRYSVRLIGFARGRSVLVSTPMDAGRYLLMREGQAFVLRAFSGKNAYAFPTHIVKSVNTPYPYLHLSYPAHVKSLVVRKGARANVNLICAITRCGDTPVQAAGTLRNISIGGALLATRQQPGDVGQELTIKFKTEVNAIEVLLELNAVIRAVNVVQEEGRDTPCHLGLQFIDVSPEDSIPLLAYVYHMLLEQSL